MLPALFLVRYRLFGYWITDIQLLGNIWLNIKDYFKPAQDWDLEVFAAVE
jgi:hypothetical protein